MWIPLKTGQNILFVLRSWSGQTIFQSISLPVYMFKCTLHVEIMHDGSEYFGKLYIKRYCICSSFAELGSGLHQYIVFSLLYILYVLVSFSDRSKEFRKFLVDSGSLYQNFFELEELKKTIAGDEVDNLCT